MWFRLLVKVAFILATVANCSAAQADAAAQERKAPDPVRKALTELHKQANPLMIHFDVEALVSLWTDDLVALPPGQPPILGKTALRAMVGKWREQMRGYKGQRSDAKWEGGPITGEYTFEWGTISAELQPLSAMEASPIRKKYNALLVLKRQPDGSWKFHRAIWNEAPDESPAH